MTSLKNILKEHKFKIAGALGLVVIEASLYISEPYIFGMTIDQVTDRRISKESIMYILVALTPWIAVYSGNFLIGIWRRVYDTKTYSGLFAVVAGQVAESQFKSNVETTKIVARANMARHLVDFIEVSVPEFIEQIITVVGAMTALSLLDWRASIACIAMIIPYLFVNRYFMVRITKEQVMLNNDQENEVLTFLDRDAKKVYSYYKGLSKRQTKISVLSASNYGIFKILTMVVFITILYIALDMDDFTVGQIYSVVAYIWAFIGASEYIPYLSEKWITMRDVARRLTLAPNSYDGLIDQS